MSWRNSQTNYGRVSILLHWLVALAIVGLFVLGLWMTGLGYYHPWYYWSVELHLSLGVLLFGVVILRLGWRLTNPRPTFEPEMRSWERVAALSAHWVMYLLMLAVVVSGYLVQTAGGQAVSVFDWFAIPALATGIGRQAEVAGWLHYWLSWTLIGMAGLHTAAAFKHHIVNRDRTLLRILRSAD